MLCVSGVEALYADMSHFGREPIAMAWSAVVFPALALNYIGQGAIVLADVNNLDNPFYRSTPPAALYPVVIARDGRDDHCVASAYLGSLTLTKQAISLGFIPRVSVVYTSILHRGQVYVPFVNRLLAVACIVLVISFHSSTRLANAYGLAVAVTMVVTLIAYFEVVRLKFGWSLSFAQLTTAPFLGVEAALRPRRIARRLPKAGGSRCSISAVVFVIASAWRAGRRRVALVQVEQSQSVKGFLASTSDGRLGVPFKGPPYFSPPIPTAFHSSCAIISRERTASTKRSCLLTIIPTNDPYVASVGRVHVERLCEGLVRVTARFGFMEKLDIQRVINACAVHALHIGGADTTYYSADPQIVAQDSRIWQSWRRSLFVILKRNARSVTSSLGIPADAHAKLGIEVPM